MTPLAKNIIELPPLFFPKSVVNALIANGADIDFSSVLSCYSVSVTWTVSSTTLILTDYLTLYSTLARLIKTDCLPDLYSSLTFLPD